MKTKITIISIFIIFISGLCVFELSHFSNNLTEISESSKNIINQIENNTAKDTLLKNLNETYANWQEKESQFCLIYNHKDLLEVGKEINQAISYIEEDDNKEATVHLKLLQEDLRALEKIIKFDFLNIF